MSVVDNFNNTLFTMDKATHPKHHSNETLDAEDALDMQVETQDE